MQISYKSPKRNENTMTKKLSEQLRYWRAERPDEWKMDEFIRQAKDLEDLLIDAADHIETYDDGMAGWKERASLLLDNTKLKG